MEYSEAAGGQRASVFVPVELQERGIAAPSTTQIDGRLAKLAAERAEVEAELASPTAGDYAELGRRLAHVNAETAMLEERWLELQTRLEDLAG